jgi:hypothetical protein
LSQRRRSDAETTDLETVIIDMLDSQYKNPTVSAVLTPPKAGCLGGRSPRAAPPLRSAALFFLQDVADRYAPSPLVDALGATDQRLVTIFRVERCPDLARDYSEAGQPRRDPPTKPPHPAAGMCCYSETPSAATPVYHRRFSEGLIPI